MKISKKSHVLVCLLCLLLTVFAAGCSQPAAPPAAPPAGSTEPAAPEETNVTLKVYSAWAENNSMNYHLNDFISKVREKSGGTVDIVWGGGPEAIPTYQQAEAIKNGLIDIAWTAHTYNVSHIPVLEGAKLFDAAKLRSSGALDYLSGLYEDKLGTHFLGSPAAGLHYNLYLTQEVKTLADFKGMTIRATPAYQAFVEGGLGAGVVNNDPGDTYQALERNVIQGTGWPSVGIADYGWQEVLKYVLDPEFYNVDDAILINKGIWDKLSDQQKQAFNEAATEIEQEAQVYYADRVRSERDSYKDQVTVITLSADEAQKYSDLAVGKAWENVVKNSPVEGPELKAFFDK
jgi:TRAP-type C4-dicarboxylate transport system substrate-binding protein